VRTPQIGDIIRLEAGESHSRGLRTDQFRLKRSHVLTSGSAILPGSARWDRSGPRFIHEVNERRRRAVARKPGKVCRYLLCPPGLRCSFDRGPLRTQTQMPSGG